MTKGQRKENLGKPKKPETHEGIWLNVPDKDGVLHTVMVFRRSRSISKPRLEITDEGCEYITKQATRGAVLSEILTDMGVSRDVAYNIWNHEKVDRAYKKGYEKCNQRLRAAQVSTALSGNATMQIWLGKNRLDQSDKVEVKSQTTVKVDEMDRDALAKAVKDILAKEGRR